MELLFVEDDEMIASGLIYALEQEGYRVEHCLDVQSALHTLRDREFALGLLDLSLPDGDSFELCAALQQRKVPVIFLSAVDDEANIVRGLEMGAEDYITKPFRLRELLVRIRNVLKRHSREPGQAVGDIVEIGHGTRIHLLQAKVYREDREIELTALEYRLLLVFAHHPGQILSRNQLLEGIWDVAGNYVNDNTLTVYIKRLREKLGDDSQNPRLIKTVRGMGYMLDD